MGYRIRCQYWNAVQRGCWVVSLGVFFYEVGDRSCSCYVASEWDNQENAGNSLINTSICYSISPMRVHNRSVSSITCSISCCRYWDLQEGRLRLNGGHIVRYEVSC